MDGCLTGAEKGARPGASFIIVSSVFILRSTIRRESAWRYYKSGRSLLWEGSISSLQIFVTFATPKRNSSLLPRQRDRKDNSSVNKATTRDDVYDFDFAYFSQRRPELCLPESDDRRQNDHRRPHSGFRLQLDRDHY